MIPIIIPVIPNKSWISLYIDWDKPEETFTFLIFDSGIRKNQSYGGRFYKNYFYICIGMLGYSLVFQWYFRKIN